MDDSKKESIGRIEIAPEVLLTIARFAVLDVEGVAKLVPAPTEVGHLFRRAPRNDGILLDFTGGQLHFDIYVVMKPNVNVLETSRAVQSAVIEAIDKMVGLPVESVNVHVEDVVYAQGEAV